MPRALRPEALTLLVRVVTDDRPTGNTVGSMTSGVGDRVELDIERTVAGGAGLAREDGGRVVLVDGALPGERVRVRITRSKPRMAEGATLEVLTAAPDRVEPPCPERLAGCGGCDLQHASVALQRELKVGIVSDALTRIGRLPEVPVEPGEQLGADGFRTVLRCGVVGDRAGLRHRRSNEVRALAGCLVAHPLVEEVIREGRFPGAEEVTIRVGARTGDRMVLVAPTARGVEVPPDVVVVGADELAGGPGDHPAAIHEVVARRRFRISAGSFFQARPDGAEALVRAVGRALGPFDPVSDHLVDLYGGVGLFTAGLGARGATLVERSEHAVADARVNLAELGAQVVRSKVERWHPGAADVVVADPARAGLGREGAEVVAATGARRVALVSCDPAALARDARLLVDAGYEALGVELVDMFPHTHHVEAVTAFRRTAAL